MFFRENKEVTCIVNKELFRKKNLDKLSTPDALNEYIKVASPSVWIILLTIVALLIGVIAWSYMGRISHYEGVTVYSDGNMAVCYVPENMIDRVRQASDININGNNYKIGDIANLPTKIHPDSVDEYVAHVMEIKEDSWIYKIEVVGTLPEGIYEGQVVTGSIRPMDYVTN